MKKKLLIVEDDKEQSEWLYLIFSETYDIMIAQTGIKAQELFQKHHDSIAALILDIRLPDMTAFELLNSLEKMHFDRIPPTVVQSGYEADEWIQRMLGEHRALSYLVKPFEENDIVSEVNKVIDADQGLYKGAQIQERMSLMIILHKIRQHLYHEITQLPKETQEPWLNRIMDLFNIYGVKAETGFPTGTESDFKLKTSLRPIIELLESLTDFAVPPQSFYTVQLRSQQKETLEALVPKTHFKIISTEMSADFLISHLTEDNVDGELAFLKSWTTKSQSTTGEIDPGYSIAIAAPDKKKYLEMAISNGVTQTLFQNATFPHTFTQLLTKLANRKYELKVLSQFVDYIS